MPLLQLTVRVCVFGFTFTNFSSCFIFFSKVKIRNRGLGANTSPGSRVRVCFASKTPDSSLSLQAEVTQSIITTGANKQSFPMIRVYRYDLLYVNVN